MGKRLGTHADAVIRPAVFEDAAALAGNSGGDLLAFVSGEICSDARGEYLSAERVSLTNDGAVGICVSYAEGGIYPSEKDKAFFLSGFRHGILMVIDPFDETIAFYVRDGDDIRKASAVLSERSYPDRVALAHILFRDVSTLHYLAHQALEEDMRRSLERGAQRKGVGVSGKAEKNDRVGRFGELAVRRGGKGDHPGPDASGDAGRLHHG